ncbi:MAG: ABC transporter permease [Chloroflexia bacterium]|jgi:peptide/nickel transport system permease protein|nr:ABC transporter permease [Chloroflexia bacterium]MDQ3613767.1 ABC transporter permease [Chloroflexota bacterium]
MLKFIINRVLLMIPILIGVSLVTFIIVRSIPGDPVRILIGFDQQATPEQIDNIRESYGLNQPLPVQYLYWMGHILQGDLGSSLRTDRPLTTELGLRLPVTAELTIMAAVIGAIPALILGVAAAMKRNTRFDWMTTAFTMIGISVPNFLLATVLVLVFSFHLRWLPPVGYVPFTEDPVQNLKTMILPAISLAMPFMAILMRFTRSSVLEVVSQDYVRVARAKGLSQRRVLMRHILPNAGIPILTIAGIQVAALLGGTVIVEQIFGLPGVGRYIYDAIANRDYPVVQSVVLVLATIFVIVSLVVDVLYAVLDPRLRTQ